MYIYVTIHPNGEQESRFYISKSIIVAIHYFSVVSIMVEREYGSRSNISAEQIFLLR